MHSRERKIRQELLSNNADLSDVFRQEKFIKMSESPYAFFRGSNHLYWEDFYHDWRMSFFGGVPETLTWINGDAHIYNYGAYSNHYGEAIYCMDDFDDAIVGDYQLDLWRMAISIVLDCRYNGVFSDLAQKKALNIFAEAYLKELRFFDESETAIEVHLTKDTAPGRLGKFLKKVEQKKSRIKLLDKWTKVVDGKRTFDYSNEKLAQLSKDEFEMVLAAFDTYKLSLDKKFTFNESHFNIKDIARRVNAGTGSIGSARYYILLESESEDQDDDVILDMKEQSKPPLYRHMSLSEKAEYDKAYPIEGKRHAQAFTALAEHADRYLGWTEMNGRSFSIKERSPYKSDFPTDKMKKPKHLYFMAEVWGKLLASRHKRASFSLNEDPAEMPTTFDHRVSGQEKQFKAMVSAVALNYANRVQEDYAYFMNMLQSS